MKILIKGPNINFNILEKCIKNSGFHINKILVNGYVGMDRITEMYAKNNNIEIVRVNPSYKKNINWKMDLINKIDGLIVINDGKMGKSINDYIKVAKEQNKYIYVEQLESDNIDSIFSPIKDNKKDDYEYDQMSPIIKKITKSKIYKPLLKEIPKYDLKLVSLNNSDQNIPLSNTSDNESDNESVMLCLYCDEYECICNIDSDSDYY